MRTRFGRAAARMGAATCLPAALAMVLQGLPLRSAAAATSAPDVRTQVESVMSTSRITLELTDGQVVTGAFHGFVGDWGDTVASGSRYEAWRRAQAAGMPRLGAPLLVITAAGDSLRANFEGMGPTYLVVGQAHSPIFAPVHLDTIADVRAAGGDTLAAWSELRGRLLEAPSFAGLGLQRGTQVVLVARESIAGVRGANAKHGVPSTVVIAGVLAVFLVCAVLASTSSSRGSSNKNEGSFLELWNFCSNVQLVDTSPDARFGAGDVTHGPRPWRPGETRRP